MNMAPSNGEAAGVILTPIGARRHHILKVSNAFKALREAGARNYSYGAVIELMKFMEDAAVIIARGAVEYANYAGRVTVKAVDIDIATRKLLEGRGK